MEKRSPIYQAVAYLKPITADEEEQKEQLSLSAADRIVEVPFGEQLVVAFLYDDEESDVFRYVQHGDLLEHGMSVDELMAIGLDNLYERTDTYELQLQEVPDAAYQMLLLDGNFEASLLLLGGLWDETLRDYAPSGYAVAIPSRDVLMFCDAASQEGIAHMREVVERISEHAGHVLLQEILTRQAGQWMKLTI